MNVYEHRLSTLTCPGQGELRNKEHPEPPLFRPSQPGKGQHEDLMLPLPEHCHPWREYAPLWSSLPWPDLWFSLPSKQIPEEPQINRKAVLPAQTEDGQWLPFRNTSETFVN